MNNGGLKLFVLAAATFAAGGAFALGEHPITPGVGTDARYATDAYPGFDNVDEIVKPERKEPRWFAFLFGPDCGNAKDQYVYCEGLEASGDFKKAAKQLDALVREWPTSPEAPKAQQKYAELLLTKLDDTEEAFKAYRYLLDFYSLRCDYNAIADKLRQVAGLMEVEGKEVMFVRFANTVDVRRAYESCVLRAPGAKWVPEVMLKIGRLREDEGVYPEAVKVYENLRNLYPDSPEAKVSYLNEAKDRMVMVDDWGYNRNRCLDTVGYMKLALKGCRPDDAAAIQDMMAAVNRRIAEDDYQRAKFYDSPTRTRRSAVSAYEKFLREHPDSDHAAEVKRRVEELKGGDQK